jgi:predicted permease
MLRLTVPGRWAGSVVDDLDADWQSRLRHGQARWRASIAISAEAARIGVRFIAEGVRLAIDATARDAREAGRALARQPAFAVAAATSIALGSALGIAAFAVLDHVLLRPLPYPEPDRLVELRGRRAGSGDIDPTVSSVDMEIWRSGLDAVIDLAAYQVETVRVAPAGTSLPSSIAAAFVTPNLLEVLGVPPVRGRGFDPSDGRLGEPGKAVVAHHVWRAHLGGRHDIVGHVIDIGGHPYHVVGVAPEGFDFPPGVGVWLARETAGARLRDLRIEFASLRVVARVRGTRTVAGAIDEVATRGEALAAEAGRVVEPVAIGLHDAIVGPAAAGVRLAFVAIACLYLIACANAGSLLLARATARAREAVVRASLGASRLALVRHAAVEGGLVASLGVTAGLGLAVGMVRVFERTEPGVVPRLGGVAISGSGLLFAAAIAIVATILLCSVAVLAARHARTSAHVGLNVAGASLTTRHRVGGALVAIQLAVCVVLLVSAATTGSAVAGQWLRDPGYDPDKLLVASVTPDLATVTPVATGDVYRPLLHRIAAHPGVTAVAMTDHLPPLAAGRLAPVVVEGERLLPGFEAAAIARTVGVTAGYFAAMRIPIAGGRAFTDDEVARSAPVVVVDTRVAARAGGRDAIGRRLVSHGQVLEIVGIAADARQGPLVDVPGPTVYRPLASGAYATGAGTFLTELHLVVRTSGDAADLAPMVRAAFTAPPSIARLTALTTLSQRLWASIARPRLHATAFALVALLGALLAACGVYGLVAYVVHLRTREIGVRLALGASAGDVVRMVAGQGLGMGLIGAGGGLLLAPAVAAVLAHRLDGSLEAGATVYAGVVVALLFVVGLAGARPAWRATRVDPATTLRCE